MISVRTREYCGIAERLVPQVFRSQHWRRAFVVTGNALALATIASALLDLGDVAILPGLGAAFCCAMFFGAILVPEGPMSEHESSVRDRAHRQSYVFASYVLFPLALLAAALVPERDGIQVVWALMAACLLFWGLPYSIVAWQLRDEQA